MIVIMCCREDGWQQDKSRWHKQSALEGEKTINLGPLISELTNLQALAQRTQGLVGSRGCPELL